MAALTAFYLIFPAVVIYLCKRYPALDKVGTVFICYIAGAALGNSGLLPQGTAQLQDELSSAFVALALPLLLFSMDVRAWSRTAGKAMLSMAGAFAAITAISGVGAALLADRMPEAWKLAGLTIGVYTGGTPNMAAIRTALDVNPTTYLTLHTYDILISLVYLIFCLTLAQGVMNRFLKPHQRVREGMDTAPEADLETEDINAYDNMANLPVIKGLVTGLMISGAILAGALALAGRVPAEYSTATVILAITSLGIAASFIPRVRNLPKTFQGGMYLILCFCLVVGSMARIQDLVQINFFLMGYLVLCIGGTFLLHALFCKLMDVDTDTFIITSVSAVCSPPFVPGVAAALKNKEIILSGLTTGIVGYAAGNYLGITFAYIFKALIE
ncbi:MAG: DUF819 family protein [Desulfobacterales bacterium]|nr:DUF819 family protein [Desulfobacterales bacterium]